MQRDALRALLADVLAEQSERRRINRTGEAPRDSH
jgi:hypothetical protein